MSLEEVFLKGHAMTSFLIQINLNTASHSGMELKCYCYLYYYYYHRHHRLFISGNNDNRKHCRKNYCSQLFLASEIWRHTDREICTGKLPHTWSFVLPSSGRYRVMEGKMFFRNGSIHVYLTDRTVPCPRNHLSLQRWPKEPKISAVFLP